MLHSGPFGFKKLGGPKALQLANCPETVVAMEVLARATAGKAVISEGSVRAPRVTDLDERALNPWGNGARRCPPRMRMAIIDGV